MCDERCLIGSDEDSHDVLADLLAFMRCQLFCNVGQGERAYKNESGSGPAILTKFVVLWRSARRFGVEKKFNGWWRCVTRCC